MKKNTLKIICASLLLGATSSNMLYSAQPEDSSAYESLRAGASNTAYAAIGFDAGTQVVTHTCALMQLSLFNLRNRGDAERTLNPSLKAGYAMGLHFFKIAGMIMLSKNTVGTTKQNLNYFVNGLLVGVVKETGSRVLSYLNTPAQELCAICREDNAPVNPDPSDLINTADTIKTLQCGHKFHTACVHPWVRQHHTCPACRAHQG